jgi:hypothetical protein
MILFIVSSCFNEQISDNVKEKIAEIFINNEYNDGCMSVPDTIFALIKKDNLYKNCQIDTASAFFCVSNKELTVYFIKLNNIQDGYIVNNFYLGICGNDNSKYSKNFTYFNSEMLELSDSAWNESIRLMEYPYVRIINEQLIVNQRVYNGTFYHAVISHFFDIDKNTLNLIYKFSIETTSWVPFREIYVKRILTDGNKVKVYFSKNINTSGTLIGSYSIMNIQEKQEITNIEIYDEDFKDILITSSPTGILLQPW